MITTLSLVGIITSHSYIFLLIMRNFSTYSLSNFQIYSMVLLYIMLYITTSELTNLVTGSFSVLTNFTRMISF